MVAGFVTAKPRNPPLGGVASGGIQCKGHGARLFSLWRAPILLHTTNAPELENETIFSKSLQWNDRDSPGAQFPAIYEIDRWSIEAVRLNQRKLSNGRIVLNATQL